MDKNFEILLLSFDESKNIFSCQVTQTQDCLKKSNSTWYLFINYDSRKGDCEQDIPQAKLKLLLIRGYPETTAIFEENEKVYNKKKFDYAPWQHKSNVANYIEDVLNLRMAELLKNKEEIVPLGIIQKLLNEKVSLIEENKGLHDKLTDYNIKQLKEIESLQLENNNLHDELINLNSKWYIKLVQVFQKN